ncbi:MAG: hydroxymethylglutaryl-CoA lyase [Bacteroidetes bacterium]|jgi:hydroxymethylglutaryl-CoA lyase|nr:hydroxymethylglutaryl-CoA lyase [Bacteroidota bacterium]
MKIIECPRDAMQGIKELIPTEVKAKYINTLLKVGFDTIDFGSFVSPKAIPQMHDTAAVLDQLDLSATKSKLLAIIANTRGAQDACAFEQIRYLGFPFSISETFQQRNANSSIIESLVRVEEIQNLCIKHNKELVVYISMAFGNPYGDEYNSEIVINWAKKLSYLGIKIIALSDTIGVSNKENISHLFSTMIPEFKDVEIGAHLHSTKESSLEKIEAAYKNGCQRFDVAIHGFGGCPMAKDDLTGNLATEDLEIYFDTYRVPLDLKKEQLKKAYAESWEVFNKYH